MPQRSREASSPATLTGGLEAELNSLGWIGQMGAAAEERRRHDVSCPGFHAPAVTAAGLTRHLGQARSFASWLASSPQVALERNHEAKWLP